MAGGLFRGPRALPLFLGALGLFALSRRGASRRVARRGLAPYLGRRLVILSAGDTLYAAARAMEANGVGAVLVERHGEVVGIVTDRDVALCVCADPMPGEDLRLGEVMSEIAAALPTASLDEVIELMKWAGVRRVPIVDERGKARGLVTLDELISDGAISPAEAREILAALPSGAVHAGEARPRPTRRAPRSRAARSAAHAESTLARALDLVAEKTGLSTRDVAEEAFLAVVGALYRRLPAGEGRHLTAQLPSRLRARLAALPPGPDRGVDIGYLLRHLSAVTGARGDRLEVIARGVTRALAALVSPGEFAKAARDLPPDLRALCAADTPGAPGLAPLTP